MTMKLTLPLALCAVALAGCVAPQGTPGPASPPVTAGEAGAPEADGADATAEATPSTLQLVAEAQRLIKGDGVAPDPARAAELLTQAVDRYSTSALIPLGDLYRTGRGVTADPERARDLYQRAITAGNFRGGTYALGTLYRDGALRNPALAITYFERSASQGSAPALVALGDIYRTGNGVPVDLERARDLYTEAEDAGNVGGTYGLGLLYRDGAMADPARAISYFEAAAANGRPSGLTAIAEMYRTGNGVPASPERARDYYLRAIEAGDIGAPSMGLAALYRGPVLRDPAQAVAYYEKAAATGRGSALTGLADMYRRGDGVRTDLRRARDYYEQGLAAGDVRGAAYGLGVLASQGSDPDHAAAREYFVQASDAGSAPASVALAEMARERLGSSSERAAMIAYYKQAARQGGADGAARSVLRGRGPALIATLQSLLAAAGYDPGATDGRTVPGLAPALQSFCAANALADCRAAAPSTELVTALLLAPDRS